MPFIHPAIFWIGLAAASAPVIIHLLNRRRYRVRDWAAMRFVEEAFRRQRRRLQIEQLILLVLRVLAVLLLGLSLARFVGCGAMAVLPGASGERTTVFVLDDSVSMGQRFGGASAFDLATADLAEQLDALGDAATSTGMAAQCASAELAPGCVCSTVRTVGSSAGQPVAGGRCTKGESRRQSRAA